MKLFKRGIAVILSAVITLSVVSPVKAENLQLQMTDSGIDWSIMLDMMDYDELAYLKQQVEDYMAKFESTNEDQEGNEGLVFGENVVIFDQDNVQVYLTGELNTDGLDRGYIGYKCVVVNNSDDIIDVLPLNYTASVNGWDVEAMGLFDINPHKKKNDILFINYEDANLKEYNEIEMIEICFELTKNNTRMNSIKSEPVTIYFNR